MSVDLDGMTGAGLLLGLTASALTTPFLAKMLYGVAPLDPVTYVMVTAMIALCALVSCVVPARRAARVDPLEVLKQT